MRNGSILERRVAPAWNHGRDSRDVRRIREVMMNDEKRPRARMRIDLNLLREAARRAFGVDGGVAAAYAYGSQVSGRALPTSDLDIAVVADTGVEIDPLFPERLAVRLVETLERCGEGARPVPDLDVRLVDHLPLALRGRIVTEGVLIFESDPVRRVEFETDTRRAYFDFLPLIERDAREGLIAGG